VPVPRHLPEVLPVLRGHVLGGVAALPGSRCWSARTRCAPSAVRWR
jgi:hypothetical protein